MNGDQYITIRKYHDRIMADIVEAALTNAGIRVFRLDETHTSLPGDNVEIRVHERDVEAALDIIEGEELG